MQYQKNPCRDCWQVQCDGMECPKWQVWFLEAWADVNRYAWEQMDALGRQEPEKFRYELPHMVRSPCRGCRCEEWCDRVCSLRAKWWDERMGNVKLKMEN